MTEAPNTNHTIKIPEPEIAPTDTIQGQPDHPLQETDRYNLTFNPKELAELIQTDGVIIDPNDIRQNLFTQILESADRDSLVITANQAIELISNWRKLSDGRLTPQFAIIAANTAEIPTTTSSPIDTGTNSTVKILKQIFSDRDTQTEGAAANTVNKWPIFIYTDRQYSDKETLSRYLQTVLGEEQWNNHQHSIHIVTYEDNLVEMIRTQASLTTSTTQIVNPEAAHPEE